MRVTTSRYETNLWSTHVNNVRLAEPIGLADERGFQNPGVCLQAFPFFPSTSPLFFFVFFLFFFFGSRSISRASETENPVPAAGKGGGDTEAPASL